MRKGVENNISRDSFMERMEKKSTSREHKGRLLGDLVLLLNQVETTEVQ